MAIASSGWGRVVGMAMLGGTWGGCGGSTGGAPAASGDASHFVDQLADEICAAAAPCCPATGHTAPSDCAASARQQLHAEVDPEIAAGVSLNTDAANKCLAAYHNLAPSCPAVWDRTPFQACKQALVGASAPGGSCDPGCAPSSEGEVVCATSVTVSPDGGTMRSPSICQVQITSPPGAMCDSDHTREVVHVCDGAAGSFCLNGTCSVPVALGGACAGSNCVAEAYCHNGTCEATIAVGGTCSGSGGDCGAGASCDPATLTCRASDSWKKLCSGDFD